MYHKGTLKNKAFPVKWSLTLSLSDDLGVTDLSKLRVSGSDLTKVSDVMGISGNSLLNWRCTLLFLFVYLFKQLVAFGFFWFFTEMGFLLIQVITDNCNTRAGPAPMKKECYHDLYVKWTWLHWHNNFLVWWTIRSHLPGLTHCLCTHHAKLLEDEGPPTILPVPHEHISAFRDEAIYWHIYALKDQRSISVYYNLDPNRHKENLPLGRIIRVLLSFLMPLASAEQV